MPKRAGRAKYAKNRRPANDHYYLHLAIVFAVAMVGLFLMPVGDSRLTLPQVIENFIDRRFDTVNDNHNFRTPRRDNDLVPNKWYFGDDTPGPFPFLAGNDLTPWDTQQLYRTKDGLFLAEVDPSTFIFTSAYKLSEIRPKSSKNQMRVTFSYIKPPQVSFACCADITLSYSLDGTDSIGSTISVDGRSPEGASCSDSGVPSWAACNISSVISGDQVNVIANFYHAVENFTYVGLIYYPSGGGINDVTVKQLKLEAKPISEKPRRPLWDYRRDDKDD